MCKKYICHILLLLSFFLVSEGSLAIDLYKLYELDPVHEAELAAKKEKVFFIGVWGYALYTPDAPGSSFCWNHQGMVIDVPNTSDAVLDSRWQNAAKRFASVFNKKMLELRPELKNHSCAHNN